MANMDDNETTRYERIARNERKLRRLGPWMIAFCGPLGLASFLFLPVSGGFVICSIAVGGVGATLLWTTYHQTRPAPRGVWCFLWWLSWMIPMFLLIGTYYPQRPAWAFYQYIGLSTATLYALLLALLRKGRSQDEREAR